MEQESEAATATTEVEQTTTEEEGHMAEEADAG